MTFRKRSMQSDVLTGQLKLRKQKNGDLLWRLKSFQEVVSLSYNELSWFSRDFPLDALTAMGWLVALNMSLTALWELDLYLTTAIKLLECRPTDGKKPKANKEK